MPSDWPNLVVHLPGARDVRAAQGLLSAAIRAEVPSSSPAAELKRCVLDCLLARALSQLGPGSFRISGVLPSPLGADVRACCAADGALQRSFEQYSRLRALLDDLPGLISEVKLPGGAAGVLLLRADTLMKRQPALLGGAASAAGEGPAVPAVPAAAAAAAGGPGAGELVADSTSSSREEDEEEQEEDYEDEGEGLPNGGRRTAATDSEGEEDTRAPVLPPLPALTNGVPAAAGPSPDGQLGPLLFELVLDAMPFRIASAKQAPVRYALGRGINVHAPAGLPRAALTSVLRASTLDRPGAPHPDAVLRLGACAVAQAQQLLVEWLQQGAGGASGGAGKAAVWRELDGPFGGSLARVLREHPGCVRLVLLGGGGHSALLRVDQLFQGACLVRGAPPGYDPAAAAAAGRSPPPGAAPRRPASQASEAAGGSGGQQGGAGTPAAAPKFAGAEKKAPAPAPARLDQRPQQKPQPQQRQQHPTPPLGAVERRWLAAGAAQQHTQPGRWPQQPQQPQPQQQVASTAAGPNSGQPLHAPPHVLRRPVQQPAGQRGSQPQGAAHPPAQEEQHHRQTLPSQQLPSLVQEQSPLPLPLPLPSLSQPSQQPPPKPPLPQQPPSSQQQPPSPPQQSVPAPALAPSGGVLQEGEQRSAAPPGLPMQGSEGRHGAQAEHEAHSEQPLTMPTAASSGCGGPVALLGRLLALQRNAQVAAAGIDAHAVGGFMAVHCCKPERQQGEQAAVLGVLLDGQHWEAAWSFMEATMALSGLAPLQAER